MKLVSVATLQCVTLVIEVLLAFAKMYHVNEHGFAMVFSN